MRVARSAAGTVGGLPRANQPEVSLIQGVQATGPQPLGGSHDRGIDQPQIGIGVRRQQLYRALQIRCGHRLRPPVGVQQAPKELPLHNGSQPRSDQIARLGQDRLGQNDRLALRREGRENGRVLPLASVDECVEGGCVDDYRHASAPGRAIAGIHPPTDGCVSGPAASGTFGPSVRHQAPSDTVWRSSSAGPDRRRGVAGGSKEGMDVTSMADGSCRIATR